MMDPFAPIRELRLKPVDLAGFPAPLELRPIPEAPSKGADVSAALTVGRAQDNDVALKEGRFPSVSSYHARFELRGDELWVVDLDSRNGVLVGGEPIEGEKRLSLGDQVRLGSVGPKFLVVGGRALDETVFVRKENVRRGGRAVEQMVERGNRRTTRLVVTLGVVVLGAMGLLLWDAINTKERQLTREMVVEEELKDATAQIQALEERERQRESDGREQEERRAAEIARLEASLAKRTKELESSLAAGSAREDSLVKRIAELEAKGASRTVLAKVQEDLALARTDLDKTREDLGAARRRVELFDPVNLTQARLSDVGRVGSSVVLIENRAGIRNTLTGDQLHLVGDEDGNLRPTFDDVGEEFALESTGSGFCVHPDGWIITNAHVISAPDSRRLNSLAEPAMFEKTVSLEVVFSGDSRRHPAEVHAIAEGDVDLALVKIEPFEGMPALTEFRTDVSPPQPGSDIFLFGFPLGHLAVQEGETVIASTFRGILSRNVGGQLQVDAGVHPGNSGGPITDSRGRVIGVVVSVQALPDRTAVYTIGYGIPIGDAALIWPPQVEEAQSADSTASDD